MDQRAWEEWHHPGLGQAALTSPDGPPRYDREDGQRDEKRREAARRPSEEELLQHDERHESEQQCQVGGDRNEELQPRRGLGAGASTNPPRPRTEAERDEEPTVVVAGGDA